MKSIFLSFLFISIIYSQPNWQKLNGPAGAVITALFAKGDTLIINSGLLKGVVFFSTDAGFSWTQANVKLNKRITDFVYPNDNGFIASTLSDGFYKSFDLINWLKINSTGGDFWQLGKDANGNIFAGNDDGVILSSTDNGLNWMHSYSTGGRIENFILDSDSTLYSGSTQKILKKENNTSWQTISITITQQRFKPLVDDQSRLYAYSSSRILRNNNGFTWTSLDSNNFFMNGNNYINNMIFNTGFIAGLRDESARFGTGWGVAVSNDYGITWNLSNQGLPPKFSSSYKIAASGINTYLGTNAAGVFKSTNFGESWFPINNGLTAANVTALVLSGDSTLYASCWSNGLQKSTDRGETWEIINNGLTNSYCYSIIEDENGVLFAGTDQATFRSTNKGENWSRITAPGNDWAYHFYKDKLNRIYSLNYGGGIHRTTNLGNSWTRIDNNFISSYVFGFAIDSSNVLYAGTRRGIIYKSTNDGASWVNVYQSSNSSSVISSIAVAPNGYIYAGNIYEGVLRSTNSGASWQLVKPDAASQARFPVAINSKGEVFTSGSNDKLFYSKDNGDTWIDITENLYLTTVKGIVFDKNDYTYLATDESVWRIDSPIPVELSSFSASVNGSSVELKWRTATETNNKGFEIERQVLSSEYKVLRPDSWESIGFVEGNGTTTEPREYSFTNENVESGSYKYRLKQIDFDGSFEYSDEIEVEVNNLPTKFALYQNYPNPFNPVTKIKYAVPSSFSSKERAGVRSFVTLKVYDVLGNEVATLVNEVKEPGGYEVEWNASHLASGVYYYRLTTGRFSDTKKLVLLK